jgi:hypothetical protein
LASNERGEGEQSKIFAARVYQAFPAKAGQKDYFIILKRKKKNRSIHNHF